MPITTRFASTISKDASSIDKPNSVNIESAQQFREKAFNLRKKRESPKECSSLQNVMIQLINQLLDIDKSKLLWSKLPENTTCTFDFIIDRVYKLKYKDLASLKSDIDSLFSSIVLSIDQTKELTLIKNLYSFVNDSLKLEASRLKETLPNSDYIFDRISLFRPTTDGYAFTDMIVKDPNEGPKLDYPSQIQEMIVHPAQPAEKEEVLTLKDVVAPAPKFISKVVKHENKPIIPVQWLNFGAFSSFAPASDSNNANITYESTYMGRATKRLKTNRLGDEEALNADWLAKEGLDIKIIEAALDKESETVDEKLEQNSHLLEKLVNYQSARFNSDVSKWNDVHEKEMKTAKLLEKNITKMLSNLPPNATTNTEVIESSIERLPLFEAAYRGTLPPHKIFSFPTTEKAEVLPPYANITPTYAKENWRLVRVTPFPPKDLPEKSLPTYRMLSMLEQQQMSFYQKPVFSVQQAAVPFVSTNMVPLYHQQQSQQRK
ncbi:uncharacterized protein BX663DRAFT_560572 [Cokeromyces recurvatus]|uniref:uncharacterized protein n=1 Tax=Cokeromyces recurvatus TaxID=90255 RepID=UPI00221F50D1|nr:uncharacterized protein BX663DRAFT_560572 [Cokeromyces recurvatus]KAI7903629.1 hypothetical protein BX663DRAFT_560572 [Cokeromyces recurvatus]